MAEGACGFGGGDCGTSSIEGYDTFQNPGAGNGTGNGSGANDPLKDDLDGGEGDDSTDGQGGLHSPPSPDDEGGVDFFHLLHGTEQLLMGVGLIGMGLALIITGIGVGEAGAAACPATFGLSCVGGVAGAVILGGAGAAAIWAGVKVVISWWDELTEH